MFHIASTINHYIYWNQLEIHIFQVIKYKWDISKRWNQNSDALKNNIWFSTSKVNLKFHFKMKITFTVGGKY